MSCEPEPEETLTEELPDSTSRHLRRPDGIEEVDRRWTAAASSTDRLHRDGWQGQLDSTRMAAHEVRQEVYLPADSPSGNQHGHGHGHVGRSLPDGAIPRPQLEPQDWPASLHSPPARYDLASLCMPYMQHSVVREGETDTSPSDQTSMMVKRTSNSSEASSYGSQARYHARDVGDHHPNIWLSANLGNARQSPGDQISFAVPRPPSASNSSHFSGMHIQDDTDSMWSSNRRNGESYRVQTQYSSPESSYPDTIQIPTRNLYSSGEPRSSTGGGESFKMEKDNQYFSQ